MAKRVLARLLALYYWMIDKRPAVLGMPQVAFVLQNPQRGEHGGVGQGNVRRQCFHDIGHGGLALLPNHFHQPQFGIGQAAGFLPAQTRDSPIKELIVVVYGRRRDLSINFLIVRRAAVTLKKSLQSDLDQLPQVLWQRRSGVETGLSRVPRPGTTSSFENHSS